MKISGRNYFNEAVEIAKNVAVTTTQSIFFLNRAKQTLNKDAWDKNKIEVTQYWSIDESSDDLLKLDYIIEPAPVWITQSAWNKEKKENWYFGYPLYRKWFPSPWLSRI
jgi:hypothetical protein